MAKKIFQYITLFTIQIIVCYYLAAEEISIELPPRDSLLPRTALVLSGGGARGLAQIGVLKGFRDTGINIDYVVGTSIGAIVGGMYASGHTPEELEQVLNSEDWKNAVALSSSKLRSQLFFDQKQLYDRNLLTLKFRDFVFEVPEAATEGRDFDLFLQKIIWQGTYQPEVDFDKLKIPFRAISTDLVSGKSISLKKGNLSKALRASATIPLRYTPIRVDSMILVDGGILANMPTKFAEEFNPDIIISVNTTSPLLKSNNLNSVVNIADQVISIAMEELSNDNLKRSNLVITPKLEGYLNDDFSNSDTLIQIGYLEFLSNYTEIQEIITRKINEKLLSVLSNAVSEVNSFNFETVFTGFEDEQKNYLSNRYRQILSKNDLSRLILNLYLIDNRNYSGFKIYTNGNGKLYIIANNYPVVKSINVELPANLKEEAKALTDNYLSKPYNNNFRTELSEALLRLLHLQGYTFASVSGISQRDGIVNLKFNLGRIDSIYYKIPSSVKQILVERELAFMIGDIAGTDKFVQSLENLNSSMIFKNVEIIPVRNSRNGVDIIVSLEEEPNQTIRVGGRVDNERNAQAGIDLVYDNFNFFGTRFALRNVVAPTYYRGILSFDNTRIFNSSISSSLSLYYTSREMYEYFPRQGVSSDRFGNLRAFNFEEERYGVKALLGTQLDKNGRLYTELRHEYQRLLRNSDSIKSSFTNFSTLKVGLIVDNQDRAYFPKNGQYIDLSLESNVFSDESSVGFSKASFYYHNNFNFGSLTLRPSLMFGVADATLPFLEFFNLGGEGSFFGLREEEERGRQLFKGSMSYFYELPFSLFFDTYIYGRYDIGAIWLLPDEIKISNLRNGFGLGLAFDTPLGPARFSSGKSWYYKQNPNSIVWGPTEYYFVIGINL